MPGQPYATSSQTESRSYAIVRSSAWAVDSPTGSRASASRSIEPASPPPAPRSPAMLFSLLPTGSRPRRQPESPPSFSRAVRSATASASRLPTVPVWRWPLPPDGTFGIRSEHSPLSITDLGVGPQALLSARTRWEAHWFPSNVPASGPVRGSPPSTAVPLVPTRGDRARPCCVPERYGRQTLHRGDTALT